MLGSPLLKRLIPQSGGCSSPSSHLSFSCFSQAMKDLREKDRAQKVCLVWIQAIWKPSDRSCGLWALLLFYSTFPLCSWVSTYKSSLYSRGFDGLSLTSGKSNSHGLRLHADGAPKDKLTKRVLTAPKFDFGLSWRWAVGPLDSSANVFSRRTRSRSRSPEQWKVPEGDVAQRDAKPQENLSAQARPATGYFACSQEELDMIKSDLIAVW